MQKQALKKLFLKISQYSQESIYVRASLFLIKVAGIRPATLLKRDSNTVVLLWILRNFYLWTTASHIIKNKGQKREHEAVVYHYILNQIDIYFEMNQTDWSL